jgi:cell wall-associated NlpC family hydrolase
MPADAATIVKQRAAVVAEAETWLRTPYVSNADQKGHGVDCGMLLVRVFVDTGIVPAFDPRPYPAQWAINQSAELYLGIVERFAKEIPGPPLPGDIALFKIGHCYAHGAIVIDWPRILHANPAPGGPSRNLPSSCRHDDWSRNLDLHRRVPRFFSVWAL